MIEKDSRIDIFSLESKQVLSIAEALDYVNYAECQQRLELASDGVSQVSGESHSKSCSLDKVHELSLDDYLKIMQIGQGAYGDVWLAEDVKRNQLVALKKLKLNEELEGFPKNSLREISILRQLDHPNIVKFFGIAFSKPSSKTAGNGLPPGKGVDKRETMSRGSVWMVFEYLPFDLNGILEQFRGQDKLWSVEEIKIILRDILDALDYCHSRNVMHRDLKSANLLITSNGRVKLADFGLARLFNSRPTPLTNRVITLWYRPPELLLGSQCYGASVDIWSAGCIFAELVLGRAIFGADKEVLVLRMIRECLGPPGEKEWPDKTSLPFWNSTELNPLVTQSSYISFVTSSSSSPASADEQLQNDSSKLSSKAETLWNKLYGRIGDAGVNLLKSMLRYDPSTRISAKEALEHSWFKSVEKAPGSINVNQLNRSNCHAFAMRRDKMKRDKGNARNAGLDPARKQGPRIVCSTDLLQKSKKLYLSKMPITAKEFDLHSFTEDAENKNETRNIPEPQTGIYKKSSHVEKIQISNPISERPTHPYRKKIDNSVTTVGQACHGTNNRKRFSDNLESPGPGKRNLQHLSRRTEVEENKFRAKETKAFTPANKQLILNSSQDESVDMEIDDDKTTDFRGAVIPPVGPPTPPPPLPSPPGLHPPITSAVPKSPVQLEEKFQKETRNRPILSKAAGYPSQNQPILDEERRNIMPIPTGNLGKVRGETVSYRKRRSRSRASMACVPHESQKSSPSKRIRGNQCRSRSLSEGEISDSVSSRDSRNVESTRHNCPPGSNESSHQHIIHPNRNFGTHIDGRPPRNHPVYVSSSFHSGHSACSPPYSRSNVPVSTRYNSNRPYPYSPSPPRARMDHPKYEGRPPFTRYSSPESIPSTYYKNVKYNSPMMINPRYRSDERRSSSSYYRRMPEDFYSGGYEHQSGRSNMDYYRIGRRKDYISRDSIPPPYPNDPPKYKMYAPSSSDQRIPSKMHSMSRGSMVRSQNFFESGIPYDRRERNNSLFRPLKTEEMPRV